MTYEVRLANLQDVDWIVKDAGWKMVHQELKKPELYNQETIRTLALKAIHEGTIIVVTRYGKQIGVLGAILVPHYLNANQKTLVEIMWFVDKDYRNGRAGILLLKEFSDLAKRKGAKASLSLLGSSPMSDETLAKFGFKLVERNYMTEN